MSEMSRREFMKVAAWAATVTGFSAVVVPIVAYLYPKDLSETPSEPVPVGKLADLPVGQSKTVQYGRYPALIVHLPDGLKAYSAVCTHFACIVKWNPDDGQIECPCHEGIFNAADGSVLSGPPPTPLTLLPVNVDADGLITVGEKEQQS